MPTYFVWLSSQTGPQPQIWHDGEPKNGEGKDKHAPLFKIELPQLPEGFKHDLATLAKRYPAPGQ